MRFATLLKPWVNSVLGTMNLRLDTRTAWQRENERVAKLADAGHFQKPVFPVLDSFSSFDGWLVVDGYAAFGDDCRRLLTSKGDQRRYNPDNDYFPPPDACPTYLLARVFKPRIWFEIGSGNSTKVVRQAIEDGKLATKLICVDPNPRTDITAVADEFVRSEIESLDPDYIADQLDADDVLFIDSSHEVKVGGDACHLLLNVVPRLRPGVLVHIHDVFLPYDYPQSWIQDGRNWSEQYLVQAMLQFGSRFQVIWPGYYVQRCRPEICSRLDFLLQGSAQSLWLRILPSSSG